LSWSARYIVVIYNQYCTTFLVAILIAWLPLDVNVDVLGTVAGNINVVGATDITVYVGGGIDIVVTDVAVGVSADIAVSATDVAVGVSADVAVCATDVAVGVSANVAVSATDVAVGGATVGTVVAVAVMETVESNHELL